MLNKIRDSPCDPYKCYLCTLETHERLQVITRTSGLQLGIISHFLIDPQTATVVYLSLRAKGLGGQDVGMVRNFFSFSSVLLTSLMHCFLGLLAAHKVCTIALAACACFIAY